MTEPLEIGLTELLESIPEPGEFVDGEVERAVAERRCLPPLGLLVATSLDPSLQAFDITHEEKALELLRRRFQLR